MSFIVPHERISVKDRALRTHPFINLLPIRPFCANIGSGWIKAALAILMVIMVDVLLFAQFRGDNGVAALRLYRGIGRVASVGAGVCWRVATSRHLAFKI
jgi:hypothetical protein